MLLLAGRRRQLDQNARAGAGMEERHPPGEALPRRLVDQGHALRLEPRQVTRDIDRLEADVVQALATLGEEARDAALLVRRLEQFDLAIARRQECRPHALVRNLGLAQQGQAERAAPEGVGLREALDRDPDMMDLLD